MNTPTLESLLVEFLEHRRARRFSPCTLRQNRYALGLFVRWLAEAQAVGTPEGLRRPHLEAWQRHLAAVTVRGRPLRPRSVNKRIATAKSFLRYLGERGYAARYLADAVEYVKEPKVLPGSTLSHEQARRLLESVATDSAAGLRSRTVLELLYTSGIRAAELAGLDVGDVDFGSGTARVMGKGSKERVVPIGRTALAFLENYVKGVRPFIQQELAQTALFLDDRGNRLPYHTLRRMIRARAAGAGLPANVTPHAFRRSCTTELLRGGAGMYQVKELLGHESLDTLQHYAKLTINDLKREHQRCHPREQDTGGQHRGPTAND